MHQQYMFHDVNEGAYAKWRLETNAKEAWNFKGNINIFLRIHAWSLVFFDECLCRLINVFFWLKSFWQFWKKYLFRDMDAIVWVSIWLPSRGDLSISAPFIEFEIISILLIHFDSLLFHLKILTYFNHRRAKLPNNMEDDRMFWFFSAHQNALNDEIGLLEIINKLI
jgi:hypothetical protein